MDKLAAMRTFVEVAQRASFADGARALRLSPAAATRAVATLEAELGVALLTRTTRAVHLTERGTIFADRCRAVLSQVDEAHAAARGEGSAPHGLLRLTAPVLFGRLHVLPIVEALSAAYPELRVRLILLDRVVHLVEEGFDAAVRIGAMADSALVAVKLTEVRRVLVASPDYLARHGVPKEPADLRRHRIVSFDGIGSNDEWRFGPGSRLAVRVAPVLTVNCAESAIDAATRGGGIARLLSYQVASAVAADRLRLVLPDQEPEAVPVSVLYPASGRSSPNVQHFKHRAVEHFAAAIPARTGENAGST